MISICRVFSFGWNDWYLGSCKGWMCYEYDLRVFCILNRLLCWNHPIHSCDWSSRVFGGWVLSVHFIQHIILILWNITISLIDKESNCYIHFISISIDYSSCRILYHDSHSIQICQISLTFESTWLSIHNIQIILIY